jgi:hypothetical protein
MDNTTDYPTLINDIITALTRHGEEATDGDCLDEVWGLLETAGYGEQLKQTQAEQEAAYYAAAEANRVWVQEQVNNDLKDLGML